LAIHIYFWQTKFVTLKACKNVMRCT